MAIADYNATPALNTAISGITTGEGMARADVNNAIRQLMADLKTFSLAVPTSPIPIANGGTGQTTAPLGLAALGGLSSVYQRLPQVPKAASFDFDLTMDGGHVRYTGGAGTATMQPDVFMLGSIIMLINDGSAPMTIARGTGVSLIWSANNTDANRTLAVAGMATLIASGTNRWFIGGAGLS